MWRLCVRVEVSLVVGVTVWGCSIEFLSKICNYCVEGLLCVRYRFLDAVGRVMNNVFFLWSIYFKRERKIKYK